MNPILQKEFDYYRTHQTELVEKYNSKVVVIKDDSVIGVFDTPVAAVTEIKKLHPMGTFLVQRVSPGDAEYTHTFHSRISYPNV